MDAFQTSEYNTVLICEDSLEGIFTAIYEAYALRIPRDKISIQIGEEANLTLFATYQKVQPDEEKAGKVIKTLKERFGEQDYEDICMALASEDLRKAEAVFRTVEWGLSAKRYGSILNHLSDPYVRRVLELSRSSSRECQHLKGFLRFHELSGGIMYATIAPKNNILPFLAEHFSDRFPMENFLIYDEKRECSAVHPAGKEWFVFVGNLEKEDNFDAMDETAREKYYQALFGQFCQSISIESRRNLKLQRNMLPLHFRRHMVEFVKK